MCGTRFTFQFTNNNVEKFEKRVTKREAEEKRQSVCLYYGTSNRKELQSDEELAAYSFKR